MISYSFLVNHIVPGPQSASYFVPLILLPLALLTPPEILSHRTTCIAFLPVITAATVHAWMAMGGTDVMSVNALLWSFYLLAAKDPRKDFRRIVKRDTYHGRQLQSKESRDVNESVSQVTELGYDEIPYPDTLIPRLPWVGTLVISLRLTDWKIDSSSHDRHQPTPPSTRSHYLFIAEAITRSIVGYLILDFTSQYTTVDPYFQNLSKSITSPLPPFLYPAVFNLLPPLIPRVLLVASQSYAIISQQYHLPLIVPVLTHQAGLISATWAPHLWPPYLGPASAMLDRGLAGFWGIHWHQVMRFTVSGPADFAIKILGLSKASDPKPATPHNNSIAPTQPKETIPAEKDASQFSESASTTRINRRATARFLLTAVIAFFNSGVVHTGLVPPHPYWATSSATHIRLLIAVFFWIQPLGLGLEMLASALLCRLFSKDMRSSRVGRMGKRALNGVWMAVWSCSCFPLLGEAARQLGWFRNWVVPFSLVRVLRGEEAWMWDCLR